MHLRYDDWKIFDSLSVLLLGGGGGEGGRGSIVQIGYCSLCWLFYLFFGTFREINETNFKLRRNVANSFLFFSVCNLQFSQSLLWISRWWKQHYGWNSWKAYPVFFGFLTSDFIVFHNLSSNIILLSKYAHITSSCINYILCGVALIIRSYLYMKKERN